jgi:hypothetical protein
LVGLYALSFLIPTLKIKQQTKKDNAAIPNANQKIMINVKGKSVSKSHLPQKTCMSCGRTFTWRKKWEKCWDAVKYCSNGCRKIK